MSEQYFATAYKDIMLMNSIFNSMCRLFPSPTCQDESPAVIAGNHMPGFVPAASSYSVNTLKCTSLLVRNKLPALNTTQFHICPRRI